MATYCYRCPECGAEFETHLRDVQVCPSGHSGVKRAYALEGVGIGAGVRVSRTGTMRDMADLVLPHNSDFSGPGDPDGTKGMREWRETHVPMDKKPHWPGEVERKQF